MKWKNVPFCFYANLAHLCEKQNNPISLLEYYWGHNFYNESSEGEYEGVELNANLSPIVWHTENIYGDLENTNTYKNIILKYPVNITVKKFTSSKEYISHLLKDIEDGSSKLVVITKCSHNLYKELKFPVRHYAVASLNNIGELQLVDRINSEIVGESFLIESTQYSIDNYGFIPSYSVHINKNFKGSPFDSDVQATKHFSDSVAEYRSTGRLHIEKYILLCEELHQKNALHKLPCKSLPLFAQYRKSEVEYIKSLKMDRFEPLTTILQTLCVEWRVLNIMVGGNSKLQSSLFPAVLNNLKSLLKMEDTYFELLEELLND